MEINAYQIIGLITLNILAIVGAYAKGHNEGIREGYTRGRSISRSDCCK